MRTVNHHREKSGCKKKKKKEETDDQFHLHIQLDCEIPEVGIRIEAKTILLLEHCSDYWLLGETTIGYILLC